MATVEDDVEIPADSVESKPSTRMEVAKKVPDRNIYRLVGFSFGLLCILQVALNISLRQTLYHSDDHGIKSPEDDGDRGKGRKISSEGFFCFYDDENKKSLNLTAVTETSKELLAEFCPSVYYISSTKKTWPESRKDCLKRGADLIIITSKEEQKFMGQFKRIVWIGLTDADKKGLWKWVDGTPLTLSFWVPGEPNNFLNIKEYCAETRDFDSENSWNDRNCDAHNYWICERKLLKRNGAAAGS
ncbi:C-type lectin domain family 4 member M [Fundulus heteroclitus]|uniref:C-type lectin domain family 4 member M n=1 Tax=Fundulus heteroclitus TaxID=8078 RepID=UPI00165C2460|nr:C-type lectin domain family 4 member M [Fundulus heteroclitus]XP_035992555.1 C-type lectin domain family 4 member M [Fundulus heteroclitus]